MKDELPEEHLFHHRPADWDEKYGPLGTPENYTPPLPVTNNIQKPAYLRIGGVIFGLFLIGAVVMFIMAVSSNYPLSEIIFPFMLIVSLCSYMAWWCFHLASRRAKWMKEKVEKNKNK